MKKLLLCLLLFGCASYNKIPIDLPAVMVDDPLYAGEQARIIFLNKDEVNLNVTIYTDIEPLLVGYYPNIKYVQLNILVPDNESSILIIDAADNKGHASKTKVNICHTY